MYQVERAIDQLMSQAPVSLAGALQEYLDDPNFEDNRLEYKANKKATENSARRDKDGKDKKSCMSIDLSLLDLSNPPQP